MQCGATRGDDACAKRQQAERCRSSTTFVSKALVSVCKLPVNISFSSPRTVRRFGIWAQRQLLKVHIQFQSFLFNDGCWYSGRWRRRYVVRRRCNCHNAIFRHKLWELRNKQTHTYKNSPWKAVVVRKWIEFRLVFLVNELGAAFDFHLHSANRVTSQYSIRSMMFMTMFH